MVAWVLALVFAWAAALKLVRMTTWSEALAGYGLPAPLATSARVGVPVAEAALALALVLAPPKVAGGLVLGAAAAFSAAIAYAARRQGAVLPCGCFGRRKTMDVRLMLARNAAIATGGLVLLLWGKTPAALDRNSVPEPGEALPAVLVAAGVALAAWAAAAVLMLFKRGER